jgi:cell division septum initiation protein DivIVA
VSRHGNIQSLSDDVPTERNFEIVLRGYSRREVDRYVSLLEGQIGALSAERQDNESQLRNLTAQLHQVQMELIELRRQPGAADKVTFRHLGPRAEQILALAEEQADAIREEARKDVNDERAEVQRLIAEAKQRASAIVREADDELSRARASQARELNLHRETVFAETTQTENRAEQLRHEAEQLLSAAKQEAARITQAAAGEADRLRNEGAAQSKALRAKAEEESGALGAAAEHYAQQTRTSAEQHAQQTRAAAEHSASEVILQAERHATQIRSGAEAHAGRLHSTAQSAAAQIQQEAERAAAYALNNAREEISRLHAEAEEEEPANAGGTHSALKRHRAMPNPAGAKKQPDSTDSERTSDDPLGIDAITEDPRTPEDPPVATS